MFAGCNGNGCRLLYPPSLICTRKLSSWKKNHSSVEAVKRRHRGVRGRLGGDFEDDPLFQAAMKRASLRFQETTRTPEPLFHDPYAGCFVDSDVQVDMKQAQLARTSTNHYCLATKFIDDKLLHVVNHTEAVRQIVLLTDGMETRAYRLKWPNSSVIYDISPESIFQAAAQKLAGVGAKIPKSCLFLHVPSESCDKQEILCRKGFNGNRPSIWALQGLPLMTLSSFVDVLTLVGSLATKGCFFIGELPARFAETEVITKPDSREWIEKLFMSNGFRVNVICYDQVAAEMGRDSSQQGECRNMLFVAEQLRLSDFQMESWRNEFQRLEEEGDEQGFDEL